MSSSLQLQTHRFKAMGSPCELKFYASPGTAEALQSRACQRLQQLEDKYTRYRDTSITSTINRHAGEGEPQKLDDETLGLLHYADTLFQQSNGLFDITSGILRRAWNFRSGTLPSDDQIARLLPLVGWHQVIWEPPFFQLPFAGMEIDFGGFVKEYAADQLAALLRNEGIEHGLVNLGGDIVVIGPHPDGSPWTVGIQHPRLADTPIARLSVSQGAVTTSGDYERYMLIDGVRYSHLLNPRTGWPVQPAFSSVTVLAGQCLIAGSFSSLAMLKSESEPRWLENTGVHYLLVDQNMVAGGNVASAERPDSP